MSACGLDYGQTKAALATVVENGVCDDDPRVLPRVNEAIHALMHLRDPQSGVAVIPVGCMATYDVTAVGTTLLLPKELENAIQATVLSGSVNGQTDVTQGWYDLVNPFTYVDPAGIKDNPLVDLFLVPDVGDPSILRRKYDYPGLASGSVVRVTGAKRFIPITQDSDCLLIQNIRAIKLMIQAIDREENNAFEQSNVLIQRATEMLLAEIKGHQLDPRNMAKRKASYEADVTIFAAGTLGRTRARLALELPDFLLSGKLDITYLVNRAVQLLVDARNQMAISGRLQINAGVTELVYAPATTGATVLAWSDYNQIRLLVESFAMEQSTLSSEPGSKAERIAVTEKLQAQAFALQQAQLVETTAILRHTDYTTALSNFITAGSFDTLGYVRSKLGLELPDGLTYSFAEMRRMVNEAALEAVNHYNFLGRNERYGKDEGPNEIIFVYATSDNSVLSYSNFEILRLLVLAQKGSEAERAQAFSLIERNLSKEVESERFAAHTLALATYGTGTFGWTVGRIGVDYPPALLFPVPKLARIVEQAEMRLMDKGAPVGTLEEFRAQVFSGRIITPARVKSILMANFGCGSVDLRSIFFKYQKNGPGMNSCQEGFLQDEGLITFLSTGQRRRMYRLGGYDSEPLSADTPNHNGSSSIFTVTSTLYIGSSSRLVSIPGGVALEVKDSDGNWIRQWTQTES